MFRLNPRELNRLPIGWELVQNVGSRLIHLAVYSDALFLAHTLRQPSGGAYDDLTLWEQIDAGAQYTPAKKWLTSVPIFL